MMKKKSPAWRTPVEPEEKKSTSVRLDGAMYDTIAAFAVAEKCSKTEAFRRLLEGGLGWRGWEPPRRAA
jgi:hypothetical protein